MSSGLDQLLGALGEEFEAFEAAERSNEDAGEESGTDRQGPSGRAKGQGTSKAAPGRGHSAKRGRGGKGVAAGRTATMAGGLQHKHMDIVLDVCFLCSGGVCALQPHRNSELVKHGSQQV